MINHRVCDHEATPAARRACRRAYQANQVQLQQEEPGRLTAAQELLAQATGKLRMQAESMLDALALEQGYPVAFRLSEQAVRKAGTWQGAMDLLHAETIPPTEPYRKRAIVVNFLMKDGTRKQVVFDRYGMNAELFTSALANGWSAERTVAQACSNAIAAVLGEYGTQSIENHSVHEIS